MKFWPFKKRHSQEHIEERQNIEEVKRRQRRVELELRTITTYANRHNRGRQ